MRMEIPLRFGWLATGWHSDTASKILRPFKNAACANDLSPFGEQGCVVVCEYLDDHVLVILQAFVGMPR